MAVRAAQRQRPPFLPEAAHHFLRRRALEIGGVGLFAFTGLLALALVTYDPGDPSFNTASSGHVANLAGIPGSYAADVLLQSLGAACALLVAVLAAWAWALLSHRGLKVIWLRLSLAPVGAILAAMGFATLPAPTGWPVASGLGGLFGHITASRLEPLFEHWGAGSLAFAALAFLLGGAAFAGALGLPWREWRAMLKGAATAVRSVLGALFTVASWLQALAERAADREERDRQSKQRVVKVRRPARAAKLALDEYEPAHPPQQRARVVRETRGKAPVAKTVKSALAEQQTRHAQGTLDLVGADNYELPDLVHLTASATRDKTEGLSEEILQYNAKLLVSVLEDFSVYGEIVRVRPGPVVTLYEFVPQPGTRTSRVIGLADDIARSMSAISVRVATIPGRNVIGIELPNARREVVLLRELISSDAYENTAARLTLALGKDISGNPVVADLDRMPHLLVAGTTGSGKSVALNSMILSLLYRLSPDQCKLILIDPKMLELSVYEDIPHLLTPVVTDPSKAVVALKWTVREMENRYQAMSKLGVRNITGYNKRLAEARRKGEHLTRRVQTHVDAETGEPKYEEQELDLSHMPYIVVVVDEMADLMLVAGKDIEGAVQRLAQMARAAGIHIIMATQRPSVDVITGTIKANFPTRISFHVTSKIDSRTIIGEPGAEQLLGQGDMLFLEGGGRLKRVHGPFVSDKEVEQVADALRLQGQPDYVPGVTDEPDAGPASLGEAAAEDPLYDQAVALIARERKASTSFIQRHLQIGYNRAARIIERMESEGVVGQANHVGKREVLVNDVSDM